MNGKKIIIIIGIIVFVTILVLSIIIINKTKEKNQLEFEQEDVFVPQTTVQRIKSRNKYYAIETIIESYFEELKSGNIEGLYNILNTSYITDFEITKQNIIEKLNVYNINEESYSTIIIEKMLVNESSSSYNTNFVYGYIRDNVSNQINRFEFIVETDSSSNCYCIIPSNGVEKLGFSALEDGQSIKTSENSIIKNEYNSFNYTNISDDLVILDYMNRYKEYLVYDKEKAYNLLDSDYKNKRFGSYEKFEKYLDLNLVKLLSVSIEKCSTVDESEEFNTYIAVDQDSNYYVFKESSVMNFSLMLDVYTNPLKENIETYNNATSQNKVAMNINKWTIALNNQDYDYMYSVIYKEFRDRYFPTIDVFIKFIQENFYRNNELKLFRYKLENQTHIYEISIINKEDISQTAELSVIMRLGDNLDYMMSFGIE